MRIVRGGRRRGVGRGGQAGEDVVDGGVVEVPGAKGVADLVVGLALLAHALSDGDGLIEVAQSAPPELVVKG